MTNNTSIPPKHVSKTEQLQRAGDRLQAALAELLQDMKQAQYDSAEFTHHSLAPELISRYRLEHNLKQGDLALLAGVTPNTLAKFNKDHTSMRVDTLLSILQALGLTLYVGPIDG